MKKISDNTSPPSTEEEKEELGTRKRIIWDIRTDEEKKIDEEKKEILRKYYEKKYPNPSGKDIISEERQKIIINDDSISEYVKIHEIVDNTQPNKNPVRHVGKPSECGN